MRGDMLYIHYNAAHAIIVQKSESVQKLHTLDFLRLSDFALHYKMLLVLCMQEGNFVDFSIF